MSWTRLCLRNLWYHARGNFAVFLGVVVGTTVLTGALLVGDSLRGSLTDLTLQRLGWVDDVVLAPRFFRQALAGELSQDGAALAITPAILLKATAAAGTDRARGVTVIGVEREFWDDNTPYGSHPTQPVPNVVGLNSTLARALKAKVGDEITLRFQKPSALPRDNPIAQRDDRSVVEEWPLRVERVLTTVEFGDRFNLRPEIEAPRTVFVPLDRLQKQLGLEAQCNALLAGGMMPDSHSILEKRLDLEDWGLVLRSPDERVAELFRKLDRNRDGKLQPSEWRDRMAEALVHAIDPAPAPTLSLDAVKQFYRQHRGYLTLESRNVLISPRIALAIEQAALTADLQAEPTLVYLANTIAAGGKQIPYSVVAALDPTAAPPLGPFLPPGVRTLRKGNLGDWATLAAETWSFMAQARLQQPCGAGAAPFLVGMAKIATPPLDEDDIFLVDWNQSPLPMQIGEEVTLAYFGPEDHGELREESHPFRLAGVLPLSGVALDPDLTPEFPGITDSKTISQWGPSFIKKSRVKATDETYWKQYRTTPKAYVLLEKGQELWHSRFGDVTSFRLAPLEGADLADAAKRFREALRASLVANQGSFAFQPVKMDALKASHGSGDFGQLFLAFSFFLIAAALLLVGLLFRLNLERRAAEIGLLAAVGYRRHVLGGILLAEGALVALLGAAVGTALAVAYAELPLRLLEARWPGGTLHSVLRPHVTPLSLVIGAGASFLVSTLTIGWGVWAMCRVPPRALLAGQGHVEKITTPGRRRWGWWVVAFAAILAAGLLAMSGSVRDPEMRAMTFFGSGSLLLTACLVAVAAWMRGSRHRTVSGRGWWSITRLGIRNAARHPGRSLLTCGLLAAAAFLLVAVEAFRRRADIDVYDVNGPSGGFSLVAESDLPLYLDLNTDEGRSEIRERLELTFQNHPEPGKSAAESADKAAALLKQTRIFALRVHAGDDASCLNLYKPMQPRILGVPQTLIDRGGFQFAAAEGHPENPWRLLDIAPTKAGRNAFGEKNTVQWILKSDLGETIDLPDAGYSLRVAGLLQDSVFQSSLLISEPQFLEMFPRHEGYNFFLIQPPPGRERKVKEYLDAALADRGFDATPVVKRIESYLAVENMYLSTFQALGALGLILGSLGLAVVLLRGVWERRGELALLRALGYRRTTLGWLVLTENAFLLLLGLAAGTLSALAAVAPHLAGMGIPWRELLLMLGAVITVGLVAGALATTSTLRAPLVPALRQE
jgi:ABC-type antimicrobial peptide transport system permease subunit